MGGKFIELLKYRFCFLFYSLLQPYFDKIKSVKLKIKFLSPYFAEVEVNDNKLNVVDFFCKDVVLPVHTCTCTVLRLIHLFYCENAANKRWFTVLAMLFIFCGLLDCKAFWLME